MNKWKRQNYQKTKGCKSSRSGNRYTKFAEARRSQLDKMKTGAKYETGITVKVTKKALKYAPKRNPEGTLPSSWRYPYYHEKYCFKKGHHDCRSADCCMFGKPTHERDIVIAFIMQEYIAIVIDTNMAKVK